MYNNDTWKNFALTQHISGTLHPTQDKTFINGLHNHMGNIYFLILFAFLQKWLTVAEQMRQKRRARQTAQRRHLSLEKKKKKRHGRELTLFSLDSVLVHWELHFNPPRGKRWSECTALHQLVLGGQSGWIQYQHQNSFSWH